MLTALVLFLSAAIHAVFRFNVLFPIRNLIAASQKVGRGQYTLVEVKSADELGLLARAFNAMIEDIRQEQANLHRQANFDMLTGLPNRMMALDRIAQEINRAKRSRQRFAMFFIDLDNFKDVNDSLGHSVGDDLLVATGARVRATLRDADTVARLGGDEFLGSRARCRQRNPGGGDCGTADRGDFGAAGIERPKSRCTLQCGHRAVPG